jgi:hypothetical protein
LGDTPPFIRSSKTVIAASGFTYVFWLPAAAIAQPSKQPAKNKFCKLWEIIKHLPQINFCERKNVSNKSYEGEQ